MLERIAEIQGVGLLHNANGKPHTCKKATLIYGENGRGKSTLATIFHSASNNIPTPINVGKTIDGTLTPKVVFQFDSGHKVAFEDGAWSEPRSEISVFDADFINRNVHSGGEVTTAHRKNLLEFALGEAAVQARYAVDAAAVKSKIEAEKIQKIEDQLSGYRGEIPLVTFEKLLFDSEIDQKLTELNNRRVSADKALTILARQVPQIIPEPTFDFEAIFSCLALSLNDVHTGTAKLVKTHISKLGGGNLKIG